jgi:hypothetical protein
MSVVPIGVGDIEAQQRFIERNRVFLEEFPKLFAFYSKVFIRPLAPPGEDERQALLDLPDDDPAVVAFEDKIMADRVIFYLGRMAADDFGEICTLSGNGRGFGSYKIVRGMYERVVTAMYMAGKPSESRAFVESSSIAKLNYLSRLLKAVPEMKERYNDEFMQGIMANATAAQAKRKESMCSKCGQPITQDAWTRVSLDVMARAVEPSLEVLYPQFYLEGTAQSHANMLGIERRLIQKDGGYTYKDISEDEARFALHLGHHLMVKLLSMQNSYFNLGFNIEVQDRINAFVSIWGKAPRSAPDSE